MPFEAGAAVAKLGLDHSGFRKALLETNALAQTFPATITNFMANPLLGLVGIAKSVGESLRSALGGGIKLAAETEQAQMSLEVMLGSVDRAKTMLADLKTFATKTSFQFPEVRGLAQQLLGFGMSAEKILPSIKAIGDVSAGSGRSLSEVGLVFAQVMAKTKLTGEEMMQFAEKGVPLRKEMERITKTSGAAFDKLVSDGKVSFDQVEQGFIDMTSAGGKFANMMERQSGTLNGLLSNLTDVKDALLESAGKGFVDGLGLKSLVTDATTQLEGLKGIANDFGLAIGEALGPPLHELVDWVQTHPAEFQSIISSAATTVVDALKIVVGVVEMLGPAIKFVSEHIGAAGFVAAAMLAVKAGLALSAAWQAMAVAKTAVLALEGPSGWVKLAAGVAIAAGAVYALNSAMDSATDKAKAVISANNDIAASAAKVKPASSSSSFVGSSSAVASMATQASQANYRSYTPYPGEMGAGELGAAGMKPAAVDGDGRSKSGLGSPATEDTMKRVATNVEKMSRLMELQSRNHENGLRGCQRLRGQSKSHKAI